MSLFHVVLHVYIYPCSRPTPPGNVRAVNQHARTVLVCVSRLILCIRMRFTLRSPCRTCWPFSCGRRLCCSSAWSRRERSTSATGKWLQSHKTKPYEYARIPRCAITALVGISRGVGLLCLLAWLSLGSRLMGGSRKRQHLTQVQFGAFSAPAHAIFISL